MIPHAIVFGILALSNFGLALLFLSSPLLLVTAQIQSPPDLPGTIINESSSTNLSMSNHNQNNYTSSPNNK
jgi:hypothetical protein